MNYYIPYKVLKCPTSMDDDSDFIPSVSVFGLGYVGLPLLLAFDASKIRCIGVDVDQRKISRLNNKSSYVDDVSNEELVNGIDNGVIFTTDANYAVTNSNISIIAVPTPVNEQGIPELSYILDATATIADVLKGKTLSKPHIIVLESTTYPTTTEVEMKEVLLQKGLEQGKHFSLAYSPERISPGDPFKVNEIPKILGAEDDWTYDQVQDLYSTYAGIEIIKASSPRTAELTKLFENIFRQVNIALVNELAQLCEKMEVDVYEVIKLASTKPFGFLPHYPGPGIGGHCIPVDPYYLSHIAKKFQFTTRFINLSTEINDSMINHTIDLINIALQRVKKSVNGSKILILGFAYKPNVSDYRNSPAIPIVKRLEYYGAEIIVADKHVEDLVNTVKFIDYKTGLSQSDAVVIISPHKYFNWDYIMENLRDNQPLVDTRGIISPEKYRKIDVGLGRTVDEFLYFNKVIE